MGRLSDTKLPLLPLVGALLSAGVAACGHTGTATNSASRASSDTATTVTSASTSSNGTTEPAATGAATSVSNQLAKYGHEASKAEKQAITALVKRYYDAAAADDGAKACALIYSSFEESIAEDYGQSPGPAALRGKTCTVVMSKFFRQLPGQPAAVLAGTEVTGVRVKGRKGFALLRSKAMSAGEISVARELGTWKIQTLIGVASGGATGSASSAEHSSSVASSASSPAGTSSESTSGGHAGKDANDGDDDPGSNDDEPILDYGHAASEADRRAITALVERYYAAAAEDDGVRACAEIYAVISETIPEIFEPPELRGSTCAAVMSKVFKQRHRQMANDVSNLRVTRVRVEGDKGLAVVYFGTKPEPYVMVHRQGDGWKMQSLFEIGLP